MMQLADNTGSTDKHRALNYLSVRCTAIYTKAAEEIERNFLLASVNAISSRLSDSRKIISVVFSFTNKETNAVENYFIRVDVTEEFPFIVTKMAPYYDR
jgi:curli biogenesis system outer membrane secretion channel CsgG